MSQQRRVSFVISQNTTPSPSNGVIQNKATTDTIRQAKIVPASQMVGNAKHAKTTLDQRIYGF